MVKIVRQRLVSRLLRSLQMCGRSESMDWWVCHISVLSVRDITLTFHAQAYALMHQSRQSTPAILKSVCDMVGSAFAIRETIWGGNPLRLRPSLYWLLGWLLWKWHAFTNSQNRPEEWLHSIFFSAPCLPDSAQMHIYRYSAQNFRSSLYFLTHWPNSSYNCGSGRWWQKISLYNLTYSLS